MNIFRVFCSNIISDDTVVAAILDLSIYMYMMDPDCLFLLGRFGLLFSHCLFVHYYNYRNVMHYVLV